MPPKERPKAQPVQPAPRRPMQELGRKGMETRKRLMTATRELLRGMSAMSLTVTAIARQAKTSSATFYVYFDDVGDVVFALAREASEDIDDVLAALDAWRDHGNAEHGAQSFFTTYSSYWDRNRAALIMRNMEADRGDGRFLAIRSQIGLTIIQSLAVVLREGHPAGQLSEEQAVARATVIFAALERIAATASLYPRSDRGASAAALNEAQIDILVSLARH